MLDSSPPSAALPLTLVVFDDEDELITSGGLQSLAAAYQREVDPGLYEVVVMARPQREALLRPLLEGLGVVAALVLEEDPMRDFAVARAPHVRGAQVAWLGAPGVASPLLVAALLAAFAAYPDALLVIPTFELEASPSASMQDWLAGRGWPETGDTLVVQATLGLSGEPRYRWLDPITEPQNVVVPTRLLEDALRAGNGVSPSSLASRADITRVQLVGDALVRPLRDPARQRPPTPSAGGAVDIRLEYFGRVRFPPQQSVERPPSLPRERTRTTISSVLVTYNMRRETPRTLQSLLPPYQRGIEPSHYELILVDNGSADALSPDEVRAVAPAAQYYCLADPPPSPAYALNYGAARATGDIIVILSDGASLLSPAVFTQALVAFRAFPNPVVITQYFYLGPGRQTETVMLGYDRAQEDRLLAGVSWASDGYRLFEIAAPETFAGPDGSWLGGWFESDCIIMARSTFDAIGGCDERFDLPGGGLMIMDLLFRSWELENVQPVKLIGEGVFHQVHGGITTNTTPDKLDAEVQRYNEQYRALRGRVPVGLPKSFYFLGGLRTPAARAKMKD